MVLNTKKKDEQEKMEDIDGDHDLADDSEDNKKIVKKKSQKMVFSLPL